MHYVRGNLNEAEKLYRAAEKADSSSARHLASFARFMQNARRDMDEAERLFRAAEKADPGFVIGVSEKPLYSPGSAELLYLVLDPDPLASYMVESKHFNIVYLFPILQGFCPHKYEFADLCVQTSVIN